MKNDTPAMQTGLFEGGLALVSKKSGVLNPGDLVALANDDGTSTPTFEDVCRGGHQFESVGIMVPLGLTKNDLLRGAWIPNVVGITPTCEQIDVRLMNGNTLSKASSMDMYWDKYGGEGEIVEWRPSVICNRENPHNTKTDSEQVRIVVEIPGDLSIQALKQEMREIGARFVSFYDD